MHIKGQRIWTATYQEMTVLSIIHVHGFWHILTLRRHRLKPSKDIRYYLQLNEGDTLQKTQCRWWKQNVCVQRRRGNGSVQNTHIHTVSTHIHTHTHDYSLAFEPSAFTALEKFQGATLSPGCVRARSVTNYFPLIWHKPLGKRWTPVTVTKKTPKKQILFLKRATETNTFTPPKKIIKRIAKIGMRWIVEWAMAVTVRPKMQQHLWNGRWNSGELVRLVSSVNE